MRVYRNAEDKSQKREMERLISEIKSSFRQTLQGDNPLKKRLRGLETDLYSLENQILLFEESPKEKKAREKKISQLRNEIDKLRPQLEEIESGKIYHNAFEWRFEFPEVLDDKGNFIGFDVIIGNPPYIRQEELKNIKPILQKIYQSYTGIADLFVYFYERGLQILKNKGYLTYISSNKYFRSGYGEKLRQLLSDSTKILNLIDFGDFPVFEEATAYPSIIALSKDKCNGNQFKALAWDKHRDQNITQFATILEQDYLTITQANLSADGWKLESSQTLDLLAKLQKVGTPLGEYVKGRLYYGIKTGLNEAFVIDKITRDRLISEHPSSEEVIKPFLRGRDVKRWRIDFAEQYLIKIESSENKSHPWSDKGNIEAEAIFAQTYPAIYARFQEFRDKLIKRDDQGRFFWELRSCKYWQEFEQPKIIIPAIVNNVEYTLDLCGYYSNDKTSICITDNAYCLLAILNSSIMWWFIQQIASSKQGGFFEFKPMYVSQIPVVDIDNTQKQAIESIVKQCLEAKGKEVKELETKINQIVYKLYGLSEEEIRIIEGETK
ncbi:MAG: Eco57I restriction-modification methylase domain-containing protein [Microcystis sp. LE19-338.1B]|nr:Eco57I restriction-modification methylase domain-containing protein [Microcystis sp. LE19-338.1B]MCZ8359082.1 Eco57I restriction-modification methylase domain-containing protein [Microcystis sp. LE19-388.1G]